MRVAVLLIAITAFASSSRPKEKDDNGKPLIPYEYIARTCDESKALYGYGIVNESLEVCKHLQSSVVSEQYEQMKCDSLRVHGELVNGRCRCKTKWKGAICHLRVGCPENFSFRAGVCTPNLCQNNGTLSIGARRIECRCALPWDGQWCERLSCWRMADKAETEHRWRNRIDRCECNTDYGGERCEIVKNCKFGTMNNGICNCFANYTGDFCDRRCGTGTDKPCSMTVRYGASAFAIAGWTLLLLLLR